MKVLFNLPSIHQYSAIFEMLKHLAGKLDSLTVITQDNSPIDKSEIPANLHILALPGAKSKFLKGIMFQSSFAQHDIIHDTFGYLLPLGVLTKLSKSKYITSGWGCSASWYYKAKEIGFGDQNELDLHRRLMAREHLNTIFCDAILVNSPSFSKDYVELYGYSKSKIHHIPEPVITNNNLQFTSRSEGAFNMLYVGHISKMKGIHILLNAFAKLVEEGHDAKLTVIGKYIPHDRKIIEQCSWKNVDFLEPMEQNELAKYFQKMDLYVHPSYQEGMPRVVMEALSHGVPVVASDLPGIRTIEGSENLIKFMETFDPNELKNILCNEMKCHRKDADYFRRARARMMNFSPDIIAEKVFKVYESL